MIIDGSTGTESDELTDSLLVHLKGFEESASFARRALRDVNRHLYFSASPGIILERGVPPIYIPSGLSQGMGREYFSEVVNALYFTSGIGEGITCAECITGIYGYWKGVPRRSRVVKDASGRGIKLGTYREMYSTLHNKWRKKFIKTSGECCACGSKDELELAHVTGVEDFFYRYGKKRTLRYPTLKYKGVEVSYRNDNLVLLCRKCHDAQTLGWPLLYALERPGEFLELMHRRHTVLDKFELLIEKRGWRTAEDLFQARLF